MKALSPHLSGINGRGKQGSVIVLVLVFVILLTFIVVAFLEEATSKIKYFGLFHNRDDLRVDAYSAMEITLATINQYREIEGALWGPEQGWNQPLVDFGFNPIHANHVRVSFEDESAKLSINTLGYDTLLQLFTLLGFDLPESQSLADGLLDWIDEDDLRRLNGFDGDDYKDMDPPYRPSNSPITSWDEFRLIKPFNTLFFDEQGRPNNQWRQFREAVSLYHTGQPNINQAPPLVLLLLQEQGAIDLRAFESYRSGIDGILGTEDDRLIRPGSDGNFLRETTGVSMEVQLLRVKVEAIRGDARFELEAMVTWSGSNAAASRTSSPTADGRTRAPANANPTSASDQRTRATGSARTSPSVVANLGYPFRFVRITENRRF